MAGKILAEGKTKIIRESTTSTVIIEIKDDVTAGDGAKRNIIKNSGVDSTEINANVFRHFEHRGLTTHFIRRVGKRSYLAHKCEMIPIEVVVRFVAAGSYCERFPKISEGFSFRSPVVEFFYKDDARHDPLMVWNKIRCCYELYDAHKSYKEKYLGDIAGPAANCVCTKEEELIIKRKALYASLILRNLWKVQNVVLVDIKLEFGRALGGGLILLADDVTNGSWRLWVAGDPGRRLDKDTYRKGDFISIKDKYENDTYWVAEATKKFLI
jgi:phosphoribosylaminoimidazole-succinocarboxamide synthase